MKLFLRRYTSALIILLLVMIGYHLIVIPAIEPMGVSQVVLPDFSKRDRSSEEYWWRELFEPGSWQTKETDLVQNSRGVLLAQQWKQIGDRTWELKPLTIILPRTGSDQVAPRLERQEVWVIDAAEGATIHFDEPLEFGGNVPSVERGTLDGKISIARRTIGYEDSKPLRLSTRDVSIDRRSISTQSEVAIEWGESIIRGRDLRILLRRDMLGRNRDQMAPNDDTPLDELELYHLDELRLILPDGGLWAGLGHSPVNREGQPSLDTLPAELLATCGGRFSMDFSQRLASLTKGVHVIHQMQGLPADEFQCQKLSMKFSPATTASHKQMPLVGDLVLQELEAVGVDSLEEFVGEKWVELKIPILQAAARAKRMRVDLSKQRIELAGKLNQPGATQSIAWFSYQGIDFSAPTIEYQAGPSDDDGDLLHAGWMVAQGSGEINAVAGSVLGEAHLRWQNSLKMSPAEKADEHWIELDGNTLVETKKHGFLTCDRLQLWLKKTAKKSDDSQMQYLPDRVLADGKTSLVSQGLSVRVTSLLLNLIYASTDQRGADSLGLMLSDSAGNPMFQMLQSPNADEVDPATQPGAGARHHGSQYLVQGTTMQAKVVSAEAGSWIDNMTINGQISIEGVNQTNSHLPLKASGDRLNLSTNLQGQVDLEIVGKPARVHVAEGFLEGSAIRFDQSQNIVWMDQPGEFTLPTSVLRSDPRFKAVEWVQAPKCSWDGRLLFDGEAVHIEGDVRLSGLAKQPEQIWYLDAFCKRLSLILGNAIDMRGNQLGQTASVERIVMEQNVDVNLERANLQGERQSLMRMGLPVLTYFVAENKAIGAGPGWLKSKFLSEGKLGQLASSSSLPSASQLQGAHLTYRDSMVAFLENNEVVIDGKVELAGGPLKTWEEDIDVLRMTRLAQDQAILNCDQLKVYDTRSLSSTANYLSQQGKRQAWEFQATGHVTFEGLTSTGGYAGNGYQVTYQQAKDLLYLRGDGKTPAFLQRTPLNVQAEAVLSAHVNSAAINLKTMAVEDLQLSHFNATFPERAGRLNGNEPALPTSTAPSLDAPNPREGVSNFFQPKSR